MRESSSDETNDLITWSKLNYIYSVEYTCSDEGISFHLIFERDILNSVNFDHAYKEWYWKQNLWNTGTKRVWGLPFQGNIAGIRCQKPFIGL